MHLPDKESGRNIGTGNRKGGGITLNKNKGQTHFQEMQAQHGLRESGGIILTGNLGRAGLLQVPYFQERGSLRWAGVAALGALRSGAVGRGSTQGR